MLQSIEMGDIVDGSHNGGQDVGACSSGGSESPSNMFPQMLRNLLDVAIYSFASTKGLRSDHRIQSTEVVDGVCLMFGNLVLNAKEEVRKEFELHNKRFGGWKPKLPPTKELFKFLQSRLRTWKRKNGFKKTDDPMMAKELIHFEETDCDFVNGKPMCWRCSIPCRNCNNSNGDWRLSFRAE